MQASASAVGPTLLLALVQDGRWIAPYKVTWSNTPLLLFLVLKTTDLLTQAMTELSQTLRTDFRTPQGEYQRIQYIPVSQSTTGLQQPQHIQLQVVQVAQVSAFGLAFASLSPAAIEASAKPLPHSVVVGKHKTQHKLEYKSVVLVVVNSWLNNAAASAIQGATEAGLCVPFAVVSHHTATIS